MAPDESESDKRMERFNYWFRYNLCGPVIYCKSTERRECFLPNEISVNEHNLQELAHGTKRKKDQFAGIYEGLHDQMPGNNRKSFIIDTIQYLINIPTRRSIVALFHAM